MHKLILHFKQRPKTAILLLAIAVVLTVVWQFAGWQSTTDTWETSESPSVTRGWSMVVQDKNAVMDSLVAAPPMAGERAMMPYLDDTAGVTAADVDQKIIKTSSLDILVQKVADAAMRIGSLAIDRGGFVQSSSVTERGDGSYMGSVIVRVPVDTFDETMTAIRGLATLVRNETSNGQDVTEQYTDLQAQIRNAKAQEETYLDVLKQARSVEDILKVQERLGMIRSQIESLQGRLQYLTNATSYSTISVSLSEEPGVRAPTKAFRLGAIIKEAVQTLVAAVQNLIAGLIYALIVWGGILLPLFLIGWLIVRAWKRRKMSGKKR